MELFNIHIGAPMKTLLYSAILLLICLSLSASAQSFDCSKATSEAESLICSDGGLQYLDTKLTELYQQSLFNTKETQKLLNEQRNWLKERDKSINPEDMKASYGKRIKELEEELAKIEPINLKDIEGTPYYFSHRPPYDLSSGKIDLTLTDAQGRTALMAMFFYRNSFDNLSRLIDASDINAQDFSGKTALMYAVARIRDEWSTYDDVKALIAGGANVDIKDKSGKTAMDYASVRKVKLYIRTFSKLPVQYTSLPDTDELYRQRYGDTEPYSGDDPDSNLLNLSIKRYELSNGRPFDMSWIDPKCPLCILQDWYDSFYNPDNSQFCRDIRDHKIKFNEGDRIEYDNITYKLETFSEGTAHYGGIRVINLSDNRTVDLTPFRFANGFDVKSHNKDLYVIYLDTNSGYNYYKFRPDRMVLEQVCELLPVKPVFSTNNKSKVCSQVINGDYTEIRPVPLKSLMGDDYATLRTEYSKCRSNYEKSVRGKILGIKEEDERLAEYKACIDSVEVAEGKFSTFMHDYYYLCYDGRSRSNPSFIYGLDETLIITDHNNDGQDDFIAPWMYSSGAGRGCVINYLAVYKNNEYTPLAGSYSYYISCYGGSQHLIRIDNVVYLLTKDRHGIKYLHKINTNEAGEDKPEELCDFKVEYEYW